MSEAKELAIKTIKTLKNEGFASLSRKTKNYIRTTQIAGKDAKYKIFKDVLFINGCDESVPHPARYRVTHQREQLEANHISTNEVYYMNLKVDQVRFYRVFVFFRCPYTDVVGEVISEAKKLNKRVLFDIDDLVIDTKYTDTIKYLDSMSKEDRALYDDGVNRMGKTLQLCDAAITTTERLANELGKYVDEVFINRNTASEQMWELSEQVLYERDVLPALDSRLLDKKEFASYQKAIADRDARKGKVRIGYFSGSITHNDDFLLVLPVIVEVMKKFPQVELHIVGELALPEALGSYADSVVAHPFVDWKKLPQLISQVDINLAPLEESVFNEAKSENKWVEAALVKVPTIASNVGAFKQMIENDVTGILCDTPKEWQQALETLIVDEKKRAAIAQHAYCYCTQNCVTMYTGNPVAQFVKKYMTTNIAFILPSMQISGGIRVALKHACILQDRGYDVLLLNVDNKTEWYKFEGHTFPVLGQNGKMLEGRIDKAVATMWVTMSFLENYKNIQERYYLVQNFETDFYRQGDFLRMRANATYSPIVPVQFITISKWCQKWLLEKYGRKASYAPNGIDEKFFSCKKRDFHGRKIRILIEGDCGVYYKNVDESFEITNRLDSAKFEIWYMSYSSKPKEHYRIDKFLHQIPYEKVSKVYEACDILLKTSLLESFSYPPLEMMASGGYAVVVPNDGNKEYLVHEENCLLYPAGNIDAGIQSVMRICEDEALQEKLFEEGQKTVIRRNWRNIEKEIVALYTGE